MLSFGLKGRAQLRCGERATALSARAVVGLDLRLDLGEREAEALGEPYIAQPLHRLCGIFAIAVAAALRAQERAFLVERRCPG